MLSMSAISAVSAHNMLLFAILASAAATQSGHDMWEFDGRARVERRSGKEVEPPAMLKILDFSLDVDRAADDNGSYTHASLEKEELPPSFTICSAFMVEAWITDFSAAEIFALKTREGVTWAYVH